jgi:hypothetical protein
MADDMSDFIIRKKDGWLEISNLATEMESQREFWSYIGKGDVENAAGLLDMEVGDLLENLIGTDSISGFKAISVPDDILGERLRVWVRTEKSSGNLKKRR